MKIMHKKTLVCIFFTHIFVKLHSELADLTQLYLVGVGVQI